MSNTDSFVDEVSEELRRDQLFALFRRYGWIAISVVVLIVGGAGYFEWQKARETAAAQALGDAVLEAMRQDSSEARLAALAEVEASGEAEVLIALLSAGEHLGADDTPAALASLQQVIDNPQFDAHYRQMATLKLVMLQGADVAAQARIDTLTPLAAAGAPFRPLALEQLALIALEQDDTETAIEQLRAAAASSDATPDLRQRATQLIVALGGDPSAQE